MFGVGMPELMIIFVIALLVFGPKELPKIARTLGKAMSELRRASDDLRDGIQREIDLASREEPETPPAPPVAVASTTIAGATPSPPSEQTSMGADVQGGETATIQEGPSEADLTGAMDAHLSAAGEHESAGAEEKASQELAKATLPFPDGQSDQPAEPASLASTEVSAEPAEDRVITDEIMKAVTQAAPAQTPKESPSKPETVPHVPVEPVETRNA